MMKKMMTVALLLLGCTALHAQSKELYLFNWTEYMPDSVIEQFTKETGIKVIYSTFESNEAMFAKIKLLKGSGYDLVVPSTYFVNKMRNEELIQKLDKTKLTNFGNLNPKLLNQAHDPGNDYSIPYMWGTTGIMVNTAKVDINSVSGWADFWKPEFKNQLLLTDDLREVFHLGLRTQGFSGNSTNEEEIKKAYDRLVLPMPNVRLFNSESPKVPFMNGEVSVGMIWNGEAFMANQENEHLKYIYPKEGAVIWVDSLVILKGAKNVDNAHKFIDFILRPEIGKVISEEIGYASPNLKSVALLEEKVRNNRIVYPTEEDLKNAEFQIDVGTALPKYQEYWEKLKSGK